MTKKTVGYFYRWRWGAKLKLIHFLPSIYTGKNVQGSTYNRYYSFNWISWSYTIWHTVFDYHTGVENRNELHELNVQKYLN